MDVKAERSKAKQLVLNLSNSKPAGEALMCLNMHFLFSAHTKHSQQRLDHLQMTTPNRQTCATENMLHVCIEREGKSEDTCVCGVRDESVNLQLLSTNTDI